MDKILVYIPRKRTFLLNDLFYKEEQFYNSKKKFCYELFTGDFLKRSDELKKLLEEEKNFIDEDKIICKEKEKIIEYIDFFKKELYNKVMNMGIYPTYVQFEKFNENIGICSWFKVRTRWDKNISHRTYEEKLVYCKMEHLKKKEEKKKKEFDFTKLFFKDKLKKNGKYLISIDHLKWYKRNVFSKIRETCDYICPSETMCDGHKFIEYINMLWSAIVFAVEEKKVYYRYFLFENLVYKNDKLYSWDANPADAKCLKHLSYSR